MSATLVAAIAGRDLRYASSVGARRQVTRGAADDLSARSASAACRHSTPFDAGVAVANLADDERCDAIVRELPLNAFDKIGTHDHDETDALIEDAIHLRLSN